MKKNIFIVMFAILALAANAQSDYSNYLNKALEKLDAGDCESAQKNYDLYKELSGEVKNSVQVMIDDCQRTKTKVYTVGEEISHNGRTFLVAYTYADGKKCTAIYKGGSAKELYTNDSYLGDAHLVTAYELEHYIVPNSYAVQISGVYWTSTITKASVNWWHTKVKVINVESRIYKEVKRSGDGGTYKKLYVIDL